MTLTFSSKMPKEDISLPAEMRKLEIEPAKLNITNNDDHTLDTVSQHRKSFFTRTFAHNNNCSCLLLRNNKKLPIKKKKNKEIIKQPVLKILQNYVKNDRSPETFHGSVANIDHPPSPNINADNLCALVDNCNLLRISSTSPRQDLSPTIQKDTSKWWKHDVSRSKHSKEKLVNKSTANSCSQQALNPPCDVTIDELASYFETLVHIPKKMSSMAEMMYI